MDVFGILRHSFHFRKVLLVCKVPIRALFDSHSGMIVSWIFMQRSGRKGEKKKGDYCLGSTINSKIVKLICHPHRMSCYQRAGGLTDRLESSNLFPAACGIKAIILRVKVGWSPLDSLLDIQGTPARKMKAISDSVVLEEFSSNTLDLHDQHQQFAKWNLFGLCWEYSLGSATCQRHEKTHVPSNIPLNSTIVCSLPF